MLDERSCASLSGARHLGPPLAASAHAASAESRDWVSEFRREQAHLIRAAPRRGLSRLLSYGVGSALAAALAVALATQLPVHLRGAAVSLGPAVPAPAASGPAATELADAREEALGFDLAHARQDLARARQAAETARMAHLSEVEALRAAAARSEAERARAEEARTAAEARGGALTRDLEAAQTDLTAARQDAAGARAEAAAERDRFEQLVRRNAEREAEEQARRADAEAALARAVRERDEARVRLAEVVKAPSIPAPAAASRPEPQPVDWTAFTLRLSTDEAPLPIARPPEVAGGEQKAGRRPRETAGDRSRPAPRSGGGRLKTGTERAPTASPGNRPAPEARPRGAAAASPDA